MEESIRYAIEEMRDPFSSKSQRLMAENRFDQLVRAQSLILETQRESGVNLYDREE